MTQLRSPFVKLTPEEAHAEMQARQAAEDRLKKEIPEILAARLKPAEEKRYIILVYSDGDNDGTFIDVVGRTDAYREAKELAMNGVTDLNRSFIIVEGNTLEKSVSVLSFLKAMRNVFNDSFNVEDYWGSDGYTPSEPTPVAETSQVNVTYDPNLVEESVEV